MAGNIKNLEASSEDNLYYIQQRKTKCNETGAVLTVAVKYDYVSPLLSSRTVVINIHHNSEDAFRSGGET